MTSLVKVDEITKIQEGLETFEKRKEALQALAQSAREIDVTSIDDKEAAKAVHVKRKELKTARVEIQKEGKAMRDLINPITKLISAKEKELVEITQPEELRLEEREAWFQSENERIKAEAEAKEKARIQARIDSLNSFNVAIDYIEVLSMTDEQFEARLNAAKVEFQNEIDRKAKEEAEAAEAKRIEEERIAAERAELEELRRVKANQEAELKRQQEEIEIAKRELEVEKSRIAAEKQAAIDAENKRIQDEADRLKREAELEQARKDAAKKALEEQKAKEEKERIAAEKKAARQPDKEKIKSISILIDELKLPEVKSEEAIEIINEIEKRLASLNDFIRIQLEKL